MTLQHIIEKICTPGKLAESEQFVVKLAESREEIEEAQRLRYQVFNLERGKGLPSAFMHELDRDEFDDYCLHLIVIDRKKEKIVGTYRMHPGPVAIHSGIGFYSAREYNIEGLDKIADQTLEMGRSCVSPEYRNGAVVGLLWAGIGEVLNRAGFIYLLGCVSLEDTDPLIGWGLYYLFMAKGNMCSTLKAEPTADFVLPHPDESEIRKILEHKKTSLLRAIPPLFKGYLRLGVGICGKPALDHEFGTVDFLILLNVTKVPEKYLRHFEVF